MTPDVLFNVVIRNRNAVVNSRDVAKVFHKRHKNLLQNIDQIHKDWKKLIHLNFEGNNSDFTGLNFEPSSTELTQPKNGFNSNSTKLKNQPSKNKTLTPKMGTVQNDPLAVELLTRVSDLRFKDCFKATTYITKDGRTVRAYDMTRDGFTLLTMGFHGRNALAFKLAYISRFNAMEEELTKRNTLYELEKQLRKQLTDTIERYYTGDHLAREIMKLTNLLYIVSAGNNAPKLKRDRGFDKEVSAFADVLTSEERTKYIDAENRLIQLYGVTTTDYHELMALINTKGAA